MTAGCRWACARCGEVFNYWTRAQRHADETGHHRLRCVITGMLDTEPREPEGKDQ